MTDAAFVSSARRTLRRSLFRRFKAMGLSQDQVTIAVATAERGALDATHMQELAAVAAAAGPAIAALEAAVPGDPALADFVAVRNSSGDLIRDLATYEP